MKNKILLTSLTLTSSMLLTGCFDSGNKKTDDQPKYQENYILKFSHVVTPNTPKGKAAIFFEKRLEELTNGKIDVQIYPSSQLYKDTEVLAALKEDKVQIAAPSFSNFKELPQFTLFDLPFLFDDMNHVHNVQDGQVGEILKQKVNNNGYVALNFWDNHFKQFSTSGKKLVKPEDAAGQKFRIMTSEVLQAQFESLNAIPEKMAFRLVKNALKDKTIDGQENTISNIYTKKFYEDQSSLTISNHGYLGYLVVMSPKFWKSLSPDLQLKVVQAMKEATDKEREYAEEINQEQLNKILDYSKQTGKLEVLVLTPEQRAEWKKTVSSIYPKFYDDSKIGKDLIEKH